VEEGLELTRASLRPGGDQRAATNHVRMLIFRAAARMFAGSLGEADRDLLRVVELGRERGDLELVHYGLGLRGWLAGYTGKPQDSRTLAREVMEIAEKLGVAYLLSTGHFYLGVSHFWNREWEEAAASLERCLTIARQIKSGLQWEVHALGRLAEAYLGLGDNRRARATADEAVALARRRSDKLHGCVAHLALARVLLRTHGAAASGEIRTTLGEALTLVEETGGKVEEPFIRVELAELARLTGDETTRERELREAQRLFGEMGATGHAERLARELGS
jgi:tetratricopeptide (TPR) repeat protein